MVGWETLLATYLANRQGQDQGVKPIDVSPGNIDVNTVQKPNKTGFGSLLLKAATGNKTPGTKDELDDLTGK